MTQENMGSSTAVAEYNSQPVLLLGNAKSKDQANIKRFALEKFRLTIGRSEDDDIRLPDGSGVSRTHARVFVLDGEVVIEDLGSRNGTFVNRKLLRGNRQSTLKFGDVIIIGRYTLKLIDESVAAEVEKAPDVNELLRTWNAAAVMQVAGKCTLCNQASAAAVDGESESTEVTGTVTCAFENHADIEQAAASEEHPASSLETGPERPARFRSYGRKSPRRSKLERRRNPVRQSALMPVKRSFQAGRARVS